jgi:hypothetical protein
MNLRGGTLTQKRGTTYDMSAGRRTALGFLWRNARSRFTRVPLRQQTLNWLEPPER